MFKLLGVIKNMYVDSSACVRVKGGETEGCIMSSWLFNLYMDGVMNEVKIGLGRRGV